MGDLTSQSLDEYLADHDRLSNSGIELWRRDRGDFVDHVIDGKPWPMPTDVMKLGSYFEDLLCGARDIKDRYVVAPAREDDPLKVIHRGSKAYKEFARGVAGRTIILPDQAVRAVKMIEAVAAHPVACRLMPQGRGEDQTVIHWTCPVTGLRMKGRPDRTLVLPKKPFDVIVEVKTDMDPRDNFDRKRRWSERGYHRKLAGYIDGWIEATGRNAIAIIVAVSNTGRVRCCTYEYPPDKPAIQTGRHEYLTSAREIAEAHNTGEYKYPEERELVEGTVVPWAVFDAQNGEDHDEHRTGT